MCLGKIINMNVVSHACSVFRIVVCTKYRNQFTLVVWNLKNQRNEVCLWIMSLTY